MTTTANYFRRRILYTSALQIKFIELKYIMKLNAVMNPLLALLPPINKGKLNQLEKNRIQNCYDILVRNSRPAY